MTTKRKKPKVEKKPPKTSTSNGSARPAAPAAPAPKRVTKILPVKLTPDEMTSLALRMAEIHGEIGSIEAEKKEKASAYKARIEERRGEMRNISHSLIIRSEMRDVECLESFVFVTNSVETRREDTGDLIERRAMTLQERQAELPGLCVPVEPATVAPAKKGRTKLEAAQPSATFDHSPKSGDTDSEPVVESESRIDAPQELLDISARVNPNEIPF